MRNVLLEATSPPDGKIELILVVPSADHTTGLVVTVAEAAVAKVVPEITNILTGLEGKLQT